MADKNEQPSVIGEENKEYMRAAEVGDLEAVKRLLEDPRVDPRVMYDHALRMAACHGHLPVVEFLLQLKEAPGGRPGPDPTTFDNYALKFALGGNYLAVARCLLGDERVLGAIEEGQREYYRLMACGHDIHDGVRMYRL